MKCRELFEKIETLEDGYIQVWEDVCNIESPTDLKAGVDAAGAYFLRMARARGWETEVLELETAGNAICITMNPQVNAPSVVFSGHIDTVHPVGAFGSPAVRKDDKWIYGPGVVDCKGGVVACFLAMDALDRCGFRSRPVRLIIQSDEETGSRNSEKKTVEFMCRKAEGAVAVLNTESGDGKSAVLMRKGILRYGFKVYGKAVHGAYCPDGANAIAEAAHKILKLEKMKDPKGLTCNCGVIQGGTTVNTVAAECSFEADIRFASHEEYLLAIKTVEQIAADTAVEGCSCVLERMSERPAMVWTQKNQTLLDTVNRIYQENGMPQLQAKGRMGGSDASYITEAGIPCVDNLGVNGGKIHSREEYAELASLAASAKRLAAVAYCI